MKRIPGQIFRAGQGARHVSFVTCIDRSVMPTGPWAEIDRAGNHLMEAFPEVTVTPMPYSEEHDSLILDPSSSLIRTSNAVVVGTRNLELLRQLLDPSVTPQLSWVHCLAAGVDQLPFADLRARAGADFVVTHHSGISSAPLAEYIVAGFLHFSKHIWCVVFG